MSIENLISRSLRAVLVELPDGANIPMSDEFQTFLTGLESFIPQVIGEIHPEMLGQSGDGVLPIIARKARDGEVELLGHFCFIADQTLTPIHLELQLADAARRLPRRDSKVAYGLPYPRPLRVLSTRIAEKKGIFLRCKTIDAI